jgi:hypothetical protein
MGPRIQARHGGVISVRRQDMNELRAAIAERDAAAALDLYRRSARARLAKRNSGLARLHQQLKIDLLKQPAVAPVVEIALHRREQRKILRQQPPLAARPKHIRDRIQARSNVGLARTPQSSARRYRGFDQCPLRIG